MVESGLSPHEWAVMSALWRKSPQPLSGVIETIGGTMDWNYRTYATYLRRLCGKGLVGFEIHGRDKLYYPLVEKEACIRAEGRSMLQKLGGRAAKELLVYMIRESGLSPQDHEELQRLLDSLSKGGGE